MKLGKRGASGHKTRIQTIPAGFVEARGTQIFRPLNSYVITQYIRISQSSVCPRPTAGELKQLSTILLLPALSTTTTKMKLAAACTVAFAASANAFAPATTGSVSWKFLHERGVGWVGNWIGKRKSGDEVRRLGRRRRSHLRRRPRPSARSYQSPNPESMNC